MRGKVCTIDARVAYLLGPTGLRLLFLRASMASSWLKHDAFDLSPKPLLNYPWHLPWLVNLNYFVVCPAWRCSSYYIYSSVFEFFRIYSSSRPYPAISKLSFVCYYQRQRAVNPDRDNVETVTFNSHHIQKFLSGSCRNAACRTLSASAWLTSVLLQKANLPPGCSFPSFSRASSRFVT